MKKTLLALAVAMAAASGAHAAWDNGGQVDPVFGSGELLLAVWDSNSSHKVSVAQDLGTLFSEVDANLSNTAFAKSYTLDATAFSVFSTSNVADLHYAVIALNNGAFNPIATQVMVTTNYANPTPNSSDIGNVINAATAVTASYINGTDTNYAANNAVVGSPSNNNWLGDSGVFGPTFTSQSFPFDITAGVNDKLAFYEFNSPDLTGVADVKAVGQWSINLQTGSLSYAAAAPAVPVPGAAWLMGSALVGLGSIARRRRAA